MEKQARVRRGWRASLFGLVFGAGYLCGMAGHPAAQAQVGDLGKEMMKKAEDSGGAVGSAAKLGSTITEMKDNLTKLQKNIGVLEQIQKALGG
jgi:hypothetical protein